MLQIDETVISLDILTEQFCCNLDQCLGQCCIDGDAGAPLEQEEQEEINRALPHITELLSQEAREKIQSDGIAYIDVEGDLVTSIVKGKNCVFTYFDENGTCKCALEKAFFDGKSTFRKPISCHLYPIRVKKYRSFSAVNYHRWNICQGACLNGKRQKVKLYEFLKEPLVRKFGEEWYQALQHAAHTLVIEK